MNNKPPSKVSHRTKAGRFINADLSIIPIVRGIQEYERALMYHKAAHRHDASKATKEAIAEKLKELE